VDYYIALPGLVGSAACCLNLTSPLLPHGLTQRHFDTWAWGGMLLSDATPGLDIFPAELTREMTFRAPEHLAERFRALTGQRSLRRDLCSAWRDLLRREHTYVHRLERLLETVGAGSC
jgi:spore maturation protein CgeB